MIRTGAIQPRHPTRWNCDDFKFQPRPGLESGLRLQAPPLFGLQTPAPRYALRTRKNISGQRIRTYLGMSMQTRQPRSIDSTISSPQSICSTLRYTRTLHSLRRRDAYVLHDQERLCHNSARRLASQRTENRGHFQGKVKRLPHDTSSPGRARPGEVLQNRLSSKSVAWSRLGIFSWEGYRRRVSERRCPWERREEVWTGAAEEWTGAFWLWTTDQRLLGLIN